MGTLLYTLKDNLRPNIHAKDLIIGKCYAHVINDSSDNPSPYVLLGTFIRNDITMTGFVYPDYKDYESYFKSIDEKSISIKKATYLSFYREIPSCEQKEVDELNRKITEYLTQLKQNEKANTHAEKLAQKKYKPLLDIIENRLG